MKKLIMFFVVASFIFFGCKDENNPISPTVNQLSKGTEITNPNWITLPKSKNMMIESDFSKIKSIDGNKGGFIELKTEYSGGVTGKVKIHAKIHFPKKSFNGIKDISLMLDSQNGLTTFYPHMIFSKAAEYNLDIEGLDLSNTDKNNIDFVYQAPDGSIQKVKYKKIYIDLKKGELKIVKAILPHFSRYGWLR